MAAQEGAAAAIFGLNGREVQSVNCGSNIRIRPEIVRHLSLKRRVEGADPIGDSSPTEVR